MGLVKDPDPRVLERMRGDANNAWRAECNRQESKPRNQQKPIQAHRKAAIVLARLDLIDGLADTYRRVCERMARSTSQRPYGGHDDTTERIVDTEDRAGVQYSEVEQIESAGKLLRSVLHDVEEELGPLPQETRKAMADHFWCELLAQVCRAVEESNTVASKVPGWITDLVVQSRQDSGFSGVQRAVVNSTVNHLWSGLRNMIDGGLLASGKAALPVLRTLAVMMCKQPWRHRCVVEYCLDPLRKQILDVTKEKLLRVFAGDWLPGIRREGHLPATDPHPG